MQIKNRWTPPAGTLPTQQKWRDQIVSPVIFGRTVQGPEKEEERIHFGLWSVHMTTGVDRFIEAPFYMKGRLYGHPFNWKRKWLSRGQHDGSLIYCVSKNQSYDIGYHLFLFDGEQWTQITKGKDNVRALTIGQGHGTHVWTAPGPIGHPYLLNGGDLLRGYDPTRFAVDYTHAFAYDSGPDTPHSKEYLALKEDILSKPKIPIPFANCPNELIEEAVACIPEQYKDERLMKRLAQLDGEFWLSIHQTDYVENAGFQQLFQLTKDTGN